MTSCNLSSCSGSTQGTGIQTGQQGPGAQPEPGRPVQLVRLDEEGDLTLDKEALSRCLEQGGVGDAPVCLVSIIGEQRRGKSFLLNCLLRQLQSPEAVDASWMDREDEVLRGFECCNGIETVTKGVWMWDQPLWVQDQGRRPACPGQAPGSRAAEVPGLGRGEGGVSTGRPLLWPVDLSVCLSLQVAVFLVDTEGCLDLQRPMETSIKLSVFSILLSSYWIFNIPSTFTRTEADYLEMFIRVAKEVGETCNLAPIQHLDLLVRDWQHSRAYGAGGGQEYLTDITQKLEASAQQPLVVGALRESGSRCYLLPHPGTEFIRSEAGMPGNMDKYFRQYLRDYVSTVESSAGTHARTDQARKGLTGAQLAASIKDVSQYLKTKRYNFSSPVKMAEVFAAMREEINGRAVEAASQEYEQFVQQLDRDHQSTSSCLSVKPAEMQHRLEEKRQELLERCRGKLRGKDPEKQAALEELKQGLDRLMAQFLPGYEQRFKMAEMAEMREKANRKAVEDTRREYEQFREKQDRDHQSTSSCLSVEPAEMQQRLEEKRQELLERCRGELQGEDPQKQAALEELKQELDRLMAQFLSDYKLRFKMAEMSAIIEEVNRRAVEATRTEFQQFVKQLDRDHQSMRSCLRVKPLEMQQRLEGKRQELLERCRGELMGEDPQKQAALEELTQGLDEQTTPFLSTYRERFKRAEMEANRKTVKATRTEYEQFVQKQDRDHQSTSSCLSVKPLEMQQRLEGKRQELLERCWGKLRGEDPQKQAALEELKQGLDEQTTQFLLTYEQCFQMAVMEANSRAVKAVREEHEQFMQKQDRDHQSRSSCLSVKPLEMRHRLEGKRQELLESCWGKLRGEDPEKQAALEELKQGLDEQTTPFLSTYRERFKMAVMEANSRAVKAVREEHEQFMQKQDRDHERRSSCLNVEPAEMQQRLEGKRQELLERCRGELWGEDPQKQAALEELKQGLDEQTTPFLSSYRERFKGAVMEANSRAVEAARQEYEQFVQKQDRDHQSRSSCLNVEPAEMQQRLEEKRRELLERCRGELWGEDPQKQAALEELKQGLDEQTTQFLSTYRERFKGAVMEANSRAVEAARQEYEQFMQKQDRDHERRSSCLRVKPQEMQQRLEGKRQELLERCRGELWGEDPQKQAALEELKQGLDEQMTPFLSSYRERFKGAVMEANSRAVEAARQEYEQFVQKQDRDHQSRSSCLSVKPLEMRQRLEEKRQELLERCCGELWGEDPQKQAAMEELKQGLDEQTTPFLSTYRERFKGAVMEANRKAVEAARQEYEQFVQKQDRDHQSRSSCLSVKPLEMQQRLLGKCRELLERCWGKLRGEDPEKQAALEELKQGLDEQTIPFLSTYRERFKRAVMEANSRAVESTRSEYEQFVQKQDRDHQSTSSCLNVEPAEMEECLEEKRQELLERCRRELLVEDPQKQAALEELKQGLDEQTTPFLSTYRERFQGAVMEANSRAVEAARQEYEQFVQEQDHDHQSRSRCLSVKPLEMRHRLEGKRWDLQERCRGELWGEDPQKQAALEELKQGLDEQTTQFLSTYRQRFKKKSILKAVYIVGGGLAVAGAAAGVGIGVGVAAGALAVGEVVAIAVGAGGGGLIAGGLGAWLEQKFGRNKTGSNTAGQQDEGGAGSSDQVALLPPGGS
ncbi:uncharacterized protein LOC144265901 [Eretmochelys imbricata]